jgi:hypothetical protein
MSMAIFCLYGQDQVILKDGRQIDCTITKEDSTALYVIVMVKKKEVNSLINKNEILKIIRERKSFMDLELSPIKAQRKGFGYQYSMHGEILNSEQLQNALEVDPLAYQKYKAYKSARKVANVFATLGGGFVGANLGAAFAGAGNKTSWVLAEVGAAFCIIAIPIAGGANTKLREGVALYNQGAKKTSMIKPELKFTVTNNRMGLCLKF